MSQKSQHLSFFSIAFKVSPLFVFLYGFIILLNGIIAPLNIYVISQLIDKVLYSVSHQTSFTQILPLFLVFIGLQLYLYFNSTFDYLMGTRFRHKANQFFLTKIINKITKLEYHHIENKDTYDLIHRIKKNAQKNIDETFRNIATLTSGIISIVGIFFVIWDAGIWVSLSVLGIILLSSFLAYKTSTRELKDDRAYSQIERELEYFEDLFMEREIAHEVRLFNSNRYLMKVTRRLSKQVNKRYFRLSVRRRLNYDVLLRFVGYLFVLTAYIVLLYPLKDQVISIGFYIATVNALWRLVPFVTDNIPYSLQFLIRSKLYWNEVKELQKLSEKDLSQKEHSITTFDKIELQDVHFRYPNTNHDVLNGVNLIIEKGKHYAIVGRNGAGKSTIIKLLTGLYKVDKGKILIDGKDINEYNTSDLKKLFSVVFQDFGKYQISVLDNILLGNLNEEVDKKRINDIALKLDFKSIIENLPNGYDSLLGKLIKNGVDLSGGQWQKLALFRSLYSKSLVRILDEPTAALDPQAETKLYELFENSLSKEASTIFISHRLGSTKLADEIILIHDGVVREKGSHDVLIKENGLYKEMFLKQQSWYKVGDNDEDA